MMWRKVLDWLLGSDSWRVLGVVSFVVGVLEGPDGGAYWLALAVYCRVAAIDQAANEKRDPQ